MVSLINERWFDETYKNSLSLTPASGGTTTHMELRDAGKPPRRTATWPLTCMSVKGGYVLIYRESKRAWSA